MTIIPHDDPHGKSHYVYTLAYPDGHVFYIGKGTRNRIHFHEREAQHGIKSHKCNTIRKIWASGGQVVKRKIAYFATHDEAITLEIALIFLMRPYGGLVNETDGGDGTIGLTRNPHTEETRQKVSNSLKGHTVSEEARRKISEASKVRTISEETRRTLSKVHQGRKHTEESRRKMSQVQKGRIISEEHRQKLSEAHKHRTAETQYKMSEARKGIASWTGKHHTEKSRRKMSEARKAYLRRNQQTLDNYQLPLEFDR